MYYQTDFPPEQLQQRLMDDIGTAAMPDESLYIWVEDTVLVTDDGIEVLTSDAPLDLDEVEAIVGSSAA